jgi:Ethanolamine utilization protein EutJ (predicted chaperonin)
VKLIHWLIYLLTKPVVATLLEYVQYLLKERPVHLAHQALTFESETVLVFQIGQQLLIYKPAQPTFYSFLAIAPLALLILSA